MLTRIIAASLRNRPLVLAAAVAVLLYGSYRLAHMPLDVFPDLNRPTVTVMTEAPGLAPEEVELLVTRPIEYLLNGSTGVERVRSASGIGLSIVWVEFGWGTDIYRDRQVVAEKLQLAQSRLPGDVRPVLAPISSIMGEIMLLGLRTSENKPGPADHEPDDEPGDIEHSVRAEMQNSAMELRTLAEFTVRNRLLAVDGVSQVTVMGGVLKQYQVVTSPARLAAQNVTLEQLVEAAEGANVIAGGGIVEGIHQESLIRISGQSLNLEQIENTPVLWREPRAVLIKDVADVRFAGPVRRGDGSVLVKEGGRVLGGPAVILAIQKQPKTDTLELDRRISKVLDELAGDLPPGVQLHRRIFKQADFIRSAVDNVLEAVRDGALWVVVVLFLFMWNFRVSASSLAAMPISILLTVLVFHFAGITLNTMTLGGIAVAIGDLVDDSIVDIENIYRRLKLNRLQPHPENPLKVVFLASCEVRNSIVYATLIVILVVFPLFSLSGLEGRMFAPLGVAYVISLLSSLFVALTVTPVLGSYLLPRAPVLGRPHDPLLLGWLKKIDRRVLHFTLRHAGAVLAVVAVLVLVSVACIFGMGGDFLPPFNEGTLTINVQTEPGTSLAESSRVARQAERLILEVPEVLSVSRRTGRAELDEHAEGVNSSELDVRLREHLVPKPGAGYAVLRLMPVVQSWTFDETGRPRPEVLAHLRDQLTSIPTVKINIGQPISHRLDHIMSGVRAQIAVKVFGHDLQELRAAAADVQDRMAQVPGVVDLQIEPQVEIPQVRLTVDHAEAARHGLTPGRVARLLETAYKGRVVSQVFDMDRYFDLVVWFDEASRDDPSLLNQTIFDTPSGRKVALGQVAQVIETTGPNTLNHENIERRMVVSANVAGHDLAGVVAAVQSQLAPIEERLRQLPGNYRIEYGGQFEAQQEARLRLLLFGSISVVAVLLLLTKALESWRAALQVLVNIPLAAMGAVVALLVVNRPSWDALAAAPWWQWPGVWVSATSLSVAHWVGFITLIGIVSRNGIMMISHYIHLMKYEGERFNE
ncbi:MAG: efflux RND transporter permease subunit, partial [Phycisphaeraceae bacterium]